MSNFWNPFLKTMNLDDDDEDEGYTYEEDDEEEDEEEEEAPPKPKRTETVKKTRAKQREAYHDDEEEERQERPVRQVRSTRSNIVSMRGGASRNGGSMEVCLIKPTSFDDGREICDTLLSGRSVVINLEGIPTEIAQRVIDFTSGACYSMEGKMQKISNYIVIVTPRSVDLTGDFSAMVSADGLDVSMNN